MASSEAARNDLYNGLIDTLGPERAETLMTYLPDYKPSEVVTEKSLSEMKAATEKSLSDMKAATEKGFSEMKAELVVMNKRIDRVFVTLAAGMFAIFASVMGVLGVILATIT